MDDAMKIVCPACQTQYEVPEVVLTSRRKMRCVRCGGEWVPADMAEAAPPPESPAIDTIDAEPPLAEPVAEREQPQPEPAPVPETLQTQPVPADVRVPETADEPEQDDELATTAAPDLSFADHGADHGAHHGADQPGDQRAEPLPEPSLAPEPESARAPEPVPVLPPPRPVVLRAATPVTVRTVLPNPAAIVVPPAAKGPPVIAWAASITLVVVLVAAAVIFRAPIMKAWPPSTRLYVGLGLV
jgi:predicted Zn finger-like uncharacterized protein